MWPWPVTLRLPETSTKSSPTSTLNKSLWVPSTLKSRVATFDELTLTPALLINIAGVELFAWKVHVSSPFKESKVEPWSALIFAPSRSIIFDAVISFAITFPLELILPDAVIWVNIEPVIATFPSISSAISL